MKRQQFVIRNNDSSSINNNGLLQFSSLSALRFSKYSWKDEIRKCCIKRFQFNAASRKRDFVTIFTRRDRAIKIRVVNSYVRRKERVSRKLKVRYKCFNRCVNTVFTPTMVSPRPLIKSLFAQTLREIGAFVKQFWLFPFVVNGGLRFSRRVENCQASRTRKWRFERGVLKIFPILFSILETKESSTFHTVHLKNYLQLESISNSRIIANPTIFRRSIY